MVWEKMMSLEPNVLLYHICIFQNSSMAQLMQLHEVDMETSM